MNITNQVNVTEIKEIQTSEAQNVNNEQNKINTDVINIVHPVTPISQENTSSTPVNKENDSTQVSQRTKAAEHDKAINIDPVNHERMVQIDSSKLAAIVYAIEKNLADLREVLSLNQDNADVLTVVHAVKAPLNNQNDHGQQNQIICDISQDDNLLSMNLKLARQDYSIQVIAREVTPSDINRVELENISIKLGSISEFTVNVIARLKEYLMQTYIDPSVEFLLSPIQINTLILQIMIDEMHEQINHTVQDCLSDYGKISLKFNYDAELKFISDESEVNSKTQKVDISNDNKQSIVKGSHIFTTK